MNERKFNMALQRKIYLSLTFIFICASFSAQAQTQKKRSSLNYYGIGARASVLNASFVSIADDYSATHWNPAGLAFSNRYYFGGMHSQMPLSREINFVSFAIPIGSKDRLGLSWQGFVVDQIEARTGNSATADYFFFNVEEAVWLTYSRKIFSPLSLGLNLKYLHQEIDGVGANGVGLDIGLLAELTTKIKLGVVVYDIGSSLKWKTAHTDNYEKLNRIGLSYQFNESFLLSTAVEGYEQKVQELSIGAEYILLNALALRAGWQNKKFSMGTGLDFSLNNFDFSVNYSIANSKISNELSNLTEFCVSMPVSKFRTPKLVMVTCSTLNVRSGPGTDTDKVSELYMGQKFELKDRKSQWMKIEYDTNKTGWINSSFVRVVDN